MNKIVITRSHVGPMFILGIIFFVLKVSGTVAWSWWLVLLPFYVIPLLVVSFFVFTFASALFILLLCKCIDVHNEKQRVKMRRKIKKSNGPK